MLFNYVKIIFKYGGIYAYLMCIIQLLVGIFPVFEMHLTAEFIDKTLVLLQSQERMEKIFPLLVAWGLVIASSWMNREIGSFVTIKLIHRIREKFCPLLIERVAKLPYRIIEEKEAQDYIYRMMQNPEREIVDGIYQILNLFTIGIRVIGVSFLIAKHVWWCGVALFLMNIPFVFLAKFNGEIVYQANQEVAVHTRRYQYFEELLLGGRAMLERNLFGFRIFLQKKWEKIYDKASHSYLRAFFKYFFVARFYGVASILISVFMIVILINPLMTGRLTAGLFISAISQLLNVVSIMIQQLSELLKQLSGKRKYMSDLEKFFQLSEDQYYVLEEPEEAFVGFKDIIFEHVSFKYPGTKQYVLKDVCFQLKAGYHYAFTGENAAGKTTIIKLMMGLYDTYEGSILVNGKELRKYTPKEKKSLYAVVFQDFAKYHISIQDMISLGIRGKCEYTIQKEKVQQAIEQIGLRSFVSNLTNGVYTELGKFEEGNEEASNGQWQKIAIARALVNDAPICILDEPTASLDPMSEKQLYDDYGKISKGKMTILISHRLGSILLADKIFVFDKGEVLEEGTFDELMETESKFREMYEAQKSWYD